ncbi:MAG: hypothetical protein DRI34_13740 [Deltaproteobacteria bacterium]|nr:MAG: hypothetical protein DRI34_13740 [Deltaproteobacteria bacterium]
MGPATQLRLATTLALLLAAATGAAADGGASPGKSPAPSARRALVLLVPTRAAGAELEEAAGDIDHQLEQLLAGTKGAEPLPAGSLGKALFARLPEEIARDFQRARQELAAGRQNLLGLDLDQALEKLVSARVLLRRHLQWLPEPAPLVEVLMALAEALEAAGYGEQALAAYREVLSLVPDYVPDPGQLPSRCQKLFDHALEQARDLAGKLLVDSQPGGATVFLDGMRLGQTPLVSDDVAEGLHGLSLWKEGHVGQRRIVEVKTAETTRLQFDLPPLPATRAVQKLQQALAHGDAADEILRRALQARQAAGASHLLLGQLVQLAGGRRAWTAVLLRPDGSYLRFAVDWTASQPLRLPPSLATEIARALSGVRRKAAEPLIAGLDFSASLLGSPARPPAPATEPQPEPAAPATATPGAGTRWWSGLLSRWWFWTIAGGLAAGALATGLAVGLSSGSTVQDPDRLVITIERSVP